MAGDLALIERSFDPILPRLQAALANQMPVARLMQTIMVSLERTPGLMEANRQSLFNAALTFAFLGLEVDGVTGQGYLIPFKHHGTPLVQPVIGYKGYNTLAARSGLTINGQVVREGDAFDFQEGTGAFVRHRPLLGKPGRQIIAAWAVAEATDRPPLVKVLGIDELLAVRDRSPRGREPPWADPQIGFPAMCEKTAKRRLSRGMPLNVLQHAARMEEAFEEQGLHSYIDPGKGVIVAREAVEAPTTTELTGVGARPPAGAPPPASAPGAPADRMGAPDLARRIAGYTEACERAAKLGTTELGAAWNSVPVQFQANLKSTYNKSWWPDALKADRARSEAEGL